MILTTLVDSQGYKGNELPRKGSCCKMRNLLLWLSAKTEIIAWKDSSLKQPNAVASDVRRL